MFILADLSDNTELEIGIIVIYVGIKSKQLYMNKAELSKASIQAQMMSECQSIGDIRSKYGSQIRDTENKVFHTRRRTKKKSSSSEG